MITSSSAGGRHRIHPAAVVGILPVAVAGTLLAADQVVDGRTDLAALGLAAADRIPAGLVVADHSLVVLGVAVRNLVAVRIVAAAAGRTALVAELHTDPAVVDSHPAGLQAYHHP